MDITLIIIEGQESDMNEESTVTKSSTKKEKEKTDQNKKVEIFKFGNDITA